MKTTENAWIGAYYPFEMFKCGRTKTIACILFDKIICHMPIGRMACGSGSGLIFDLYGDDPLVQEQIIELREEDLLSEIDDFFNSNDELEYHEDFESYFRMNVTAMALANCDENTIPITDTQYAPIPAFIKERIDPMRSAQLQASALAINSLDLVLPPFATLNSEEILNAREMLSEQLQALRVGMLAFAPKIRSYLTEGASVLEVNKEAKYIVETEVHPALNDLSYKLQIEKGKFWKKMILDGVTFMPKLALNWATQGVIGAALESLHSGKNSADIFIQHDATINSLLNNGTLGCLLKIREHPWVKNKLERT